MEISVAGGNRLCLLREKDLSCRETAGWNTQSGVLRYLAGGILANQKIIQVDGWIDG